MGTTPRRTPTLQLVGGGLLMLLTACASPARPPLPPPAPRPTPPAPVVGLPPIPMVEGPLRIHVVHPVAGTPRPKVNSSFVYGSVGTGRATLSINGTPVEVRANGAFLAFLPVPESGIYELAASSEGRTSTATVRHRPTPPPPAITTPASGPVTTQISPPRTGVVSGGRDTLATGSDVTFGRSTPAGPYRWFLPRGAKVTVTARRADQYRVQLDTATAWLPVEAVRLGPEVSASGAGVATAATGVRIQPAAEWVDLRLDADSAAFRVEVERERLLVTLYGRAPGPATARPEDALLSAVRWSGAQGSARLEVTLSQPVWGYSAFYVDGGDLVLRVRRPPRVDPGSPLRGLRVAIDPGHPPAGATGPTGLTEAEANLAIGLRLADQLRARGAQVILTRTAHVEVPLATRVQMAIAGGAHLLVSVHNNAFAEGVNPFANHGTSTYYFHPHSMELARALDREIAAITRIPDLGAKWSNLALVRPTWLPSVLTESLFMLIPEQEAALRDPAFLDRLAGAHARGIEEFLRSVAGAPSSGVVAVPR